MEPANSRRKTSVFTRPSQSDIALPGAEHHGEGHPWETARSRKVSFGSSTGGRHRNVSVSSAETVELRTSRQSVGDPDRSRKISMSRRLTVEERGWGTDSVSGRGASASVPKHNTYKMNPERPFREKPIREIIQSTLAEVASGRYTSPGMMASKARTISDTVKQRVKLIGFDRYKLVCVVCLGQKKGQVVRDVGRCLWDSEKDGFVSVTYENATLFAIVSVYAIYQE